MTDHSLDALIDDAVLGLAGPEDLARLERLAGENPDIADRLERARQRFAPLDDTADILPLPEDFWRRLEPRLGEREPESAAAPAPEPPGAAPENVVDFASLRGRARRWRGAALAGMAAAMLFAVLLGWTLVSTRQPVVIAVLLDDAGEAVALVEGRRDNTTRITLLESPDMPLDRVMQVWTKPDADGDPVSLGLLPAARSRTLTVEGLPAPNPRQLYEITFEPAGGSPTNLPTGPILGKGLAKTPVT